MAVIELVIPIKSMKNPHVKKKNRQFRQLVDDCYQFMGKSYRDIGSQVPSNAWQVPQVPPPPVMEVPPESWRFIPENVKG